MDHLLAHRNARLRVGITRDFLEQAPNPWEMGLAWLKDQQNIHWSWFDQDVAEVQAHQVRNVDAVIAWKPRWTQSSLAEADRLLLIARWGVGYDHVDLQACTDKGVAVTITPDAVRRPVATANVAMIMALSTRLLNKDDDVRSGLWQQNSLALPGTGLLGKKLGSIGFGNIAKETFSLMSNFGMTYMAYSPSARQEEGDLWNVRIVDLLTLIQESDYLMINCPLNESTHHMLGTEALMRMKSSAFLINLSRGAIVDEKALVKALQEGQIAGAGLDVFEQEPISAQHPLCQLKQVILAPHSLALSRDLFQSMGTQLQHIVGCLQSGQHPPHVVNREVLTSPRFQNKLQALAASVN